MNSLRTSRLWLEQRLFHTTARFSRVTRLPMLKLAAKLSHVGAGRGGRLRLIADF